MRKGWKAWSMKEIIYLQENAGKFTDEEFGGTFGRTTASVRRKRNELGLPIKRKRAIYEFRKGFEVLARGTAEECAKRLGIKPGSVPFYASDHYLSKHENLDNVRVAIRID